MITLHLRYTIDPNKLSAIRTYVEAEQKPITECGGRISRVFSSHRLCRRHRQAFGVIDFRSACGIRGLPRQAGRAPAGLPGLFEALEQTGALLSIQRSLIHRVEAKEEFQP